MTALGSTASLAGIDAWPAGARSEALLALLESLTGVLFCAKDADGRYVRVNDAFVRRTRERTRAAVVGRTAAELFVAPLAERYAEQDAHVMATGRPLRQELELIRREGGDAGWYLTTKLPVLGAPGRAVGLGSVSEDLRESDARDPALTAVARVLAAARDRVADPPRPAELAELAGCSLAVLERRVRRALGLTPAQVVLRARIDRAAELLEGTSTPLAEVAAACGFYDQPSFTRQFARLAGETPGQYRRRARAAPRA